MSRAGSLPSNSNGQKLKDETCNAASRRPPMFMPSWIIIGIYRTSGSLDWKIPRRPARALFIDSRLGRLELFIPSRTKLPCHLLHTAIFLEKDAVDQQGSQQSVTPHLDCWWSRPGIPHDHEARLLRHSNIFLHMFLRRRSCISRSGGPLQPSAKLSWLLDIAWHEFCRQRCP